MPMKRLTVPARIAKVEPESHEYGALKPRLCSTLAVSRMTKGAIRTRPTRPDQVRACLPPRGQPSGRSPRVIDTVNRGGTRSGGAGDGIPPPGGEFLSG